MSVSNFSRNYGAGATIEPTRFVKITADNTVSANAAATTQSIGISQSGARDVPIDGNATAAALVGDPISVFVEPADDVLLELGETVTAGAELVAGAAGVGMLAAITGSALEYVGAIAREGGAIGDRIRVSVVNYHRTSIA